MQMAYLRTTHRQRKGMEGHSKTGQMDENSTEGFAKHLALFEWQLMIRITKKNLYYHR